MDEDIKKLIQENNDLIKENQSLIEESLSLTKKNQKKIKKIHSYIRRSFVAKIMYWGIIILVAAGAFYSIKPRVKKVIERYENFQSQIEKTTDTLNNPGSLIDGIIPKKEDIGILNRLFGE